MNFLPTELKNIINNYKLDLEITEIVRENKSKLLQELKYIEVQKQYNYHQYQIEYEYQYDETSDDWDSVWDHHSYYRC